jgi:hypothetical protein
VDWPESLTRSPQVIPGVTTVKRVYGTSEGTSPEKVPVDLYLGVDCSGSMLNPRYGLSYPVLAWQVVTPPIRFSTRKFTLPLKFLINFLEFQ